MNKKDVKFIKALITGTSNQKIGWLELNPRSYEEFIDVEEKVENAYYCKRENNVNIIVYKGSIVTKDMFDDQVEKYNTHAIITKPNSFRPNYKVSDFELSADADLWMLYKLIQRQESKVDEVMDDVINELGDLFEF